MKHIITALALAATLGAVSTTAQAADTEAGRKIYEAQCVACHGKDAKTPADPSYPILAGQYSDYLSAALHKYQSGERKNAIMAGMAKPLSKRDIENLSVYLSELPGPLTHKR